MSNVAKPWPSYRVLDDLVYKASGQFIYAATVLKFVGDPNYRPTDRLKIIASIPVISPSALTTKPLGLLDQLYSQILSMSSDKQRTLDILSALIAMLPTYSGLLLLSNPHAELLRVAEKLLGLQPGDGVQGLRMIHSLVHFSRRSLMSDVADDNLSPANVLQIYDDITFHHESFIDYLLDPSRSLEYCVDIEEMNARLALACIAIMQTLSLQPPSRIACFTWRYATFSWTHHVNKSRIPQRTLLQALISFDLYTCYLDALGPRYIESECLDTIKRVAFPSRPATLFSKFAKKLRHTKDIQVIDKTCPNPSDIKVARNFLKYLKLPGILSSSLGLKKVVSWLQTNPDSPPEFIRQYQAVINVLHDYLLDLDADYASLNDDDFFSNVQEAPGISLVDRWTNVKNLLKRRT